jgi:hypothetical protein
MISEIYSIYFNIYSVNGYCATCIFIMNSADNMDKFAKSLIGCLH